MRYGFVLAEERGGIGELKWDHTRAVLEVFGTVAELTARLRPWALEVITCERYSDGRYFAYLVELDDDGEFETYLAVAIEDVIWFYEQEYVPAP
ncbi:MAG: hypothetical protein GEV28_09585 [Actinophytocola sp.]|uniref:hypothetical protein n=1 Tax=Actinophytocola sp. TaxID=1872138 RepID=UPI0013249266|nr:hypothetical protein [Actinophytocola sp.]MPZ80621.1 hypothetical protein [Actinophytocola sp.]